MIRRRTILRAISLAAALPAVTALPSFLRAQTAEQATAQPLAMSVFEMPALVQRLQTVAALIASGQRAEAEAAISAAVSQSPDDPATLFLMAATYALQGKDEVALHALSKAGEKGFTDAALPGAIPGFAALANDQRYATILARIAANAAAQPPKRAADVKDGKAVVDDGNSVWDPRRAAIISAFAFAAAPASNEVPAIKENAALSSLVQSGKAAGNTGDLYDNRDQGHARLDATLFRDLAAIDYAEAARKRGLNDGPNQWMRFNATTVGNCSKALVAGPAWRSLPRLLLSQGGGAMALFDQYVSGMLYVYPAHRDHDPEPGDVFQANTPYMIISQGSSSSDLPFVAAVLQMLAALKPEVKSALRQSGLLMPTVQMIFRRGQSWVGSDADYLSGAAHPSAFDASKMNVDEMVARAQALTLGEVPALVALKVEEEDRPVRGVTLFEPDSPVLFDTPAAIARAFRSTDQRMRLVVSAKAIPLPGQERPQKLIWTLLRGNENAVAIRELTPDGAKAEIIVDWQQRRRVPGRPDLMSDRIDIGVFADNGKQISAPSFISVVLPGDQRREYDDQGRPRRIEYTPSALANRYVDPAIFPRLGWTDTYRYDGAGRLMGWTREEAGQRRDYKADGALVVEKDSLGRAVRARVVAYTAEAAPGGRPKIVEKETGEERRYVYDGDGDLIGKAAP